MNPADRDRLVALKKAKHGKITQRQAAEELGISERQVRRLLARLRARSATERYCTDCEGDRTGASTKSSSKRPSPS